LRVYKVPLSIAGEPKVVGGKWTLRQLLYVLCGFVFSYMTGKALGFLGVAGWVAAAAPFLFALALAFVVVPGRGIGLDRYIWLWALYSAQPQQFAYLGRGRRNGRSR
jgi:uncharacterized membrane protein YhdT